MINLIYRCLCPCSGAIEYYQNLHPIKTFLSWSHFSFLLLLWVSIVFKCYRKIYLQYIIVIVILSDWIEFIVFSFGEIITLGLFHYFSNTDPNFSLRGLISNSFKAIVIYAFIFGSLEKIKKEKFVINFTNSKTKKILLQLINS